MGSLVGKTKVAGMTAANFNLGSLSFILGSLSQLRAQGNLHPEPAPGRWLSVAEIQPQKVFGRYVGEDDRSMNNGRILFTFALPLLHFAFPAPFFSLAGDTRCRIRTRNVCADPFRIDALKNE